MNLKAKNRRRATAAVVLVVACPLLLGFAALAIDIGVLCSAKAELQTAADAAALAASSAYATETMQRIRGGEWPLASFGFIEFRAYSRGHTTGLDNSTFGSAQTEISPHDVSMGWFDVNDPSSALNTAVPAGSYNAVRVTARRSQGHNGSVRLFFAKIFGFRKADIVVSATAMLDQRLSPFEPWPFSIRDTVFDWELVFGDDNYRYDPDTDTVLAEPDGVPEILIFPRTEAAGNFGVLHIGPNVGDKNEISRQIRNGIASHKLVHTIGTDHPTFVDLDGYPVSYEIPGDTGLTASNEGAVAERIGDVVGIFLHSGAVVGGGGNAAYTITQIRYVRVMDVELNGASKYLYVQPVRDGDPGAEGIWGRSILVK